MQLPVSVLLIALVHQLLAVTVRGDECFDAAYEWFYSGPPNMMTAPATKASEKMCDEYKRDAQRVTSRLTCLRQAYDFSYGPPVDLMTKPALEWAEERCTRLADRIDKLEEYTSCHGKAYEFFYSSHFDMMREAANERSREFCETTENDLELLQGFHDCHMIVYDGVYMMPLNLMRKPALELTERVCRVENGPAEEPARQYVACMNSKYEECELGKSFVRELCLKETLAQSEECEGFFATGKFLVTGTVRHGLTKERLSGAKVSIGKLEVETDSNGAFRLEKVPKGSDVLSITMDGFIEEKRELTVEDNLLDLAFALSPELEALQWRYVLSWGRHPRDLDLYLSVSKDGEKKCTAFWQHKTCTFPGGTAVLDVDEQQGYGPETITVTLDSAEAATGLGFNVHVERYAGEGTTGASGAVVRAFNGNKAVGTWNVPTTVEATWDVYEGTPPLPQLKGGLLLSRESLPKVLVA